MKLTDRMSDLRRMRDQITDSFVEGKRRIVDMSHTATECSKDVARKTDHYVHEHTWKAVGTMALFGVALGLLLQRR